MNYNENIDLSLADFEKSICFAALIFDKHILPYSPLGGIQMFREALAPAGTCAPSSINTYLYFIKCLGRYVPLRGAVVAGACRPK